MQVGLAWITRNCAFTASAWVLSKYCALLLPEVIRRDCQLLSNWDMIQGMRWFHCKFCFLSRFERQHAQLCYKALRTWAELVRQAGTWDLRSFVSMLAPGQLLERQGNCKGLKITTDMCSWANYGQWDTKRSKNLNHSFWRTGSRNRVSSGTKAEYMCACPLHTAPKGVGRLSKQSL